MASEKPLWISPAVVEDIAAQARVLGLPPTIGFQKMNTLVNSDEVLLTLDYNGINRRMAVIESDTAYQELYGAYRSGRLIELRFLAVNKALLGILETQMGKKVFS